MQQIYDAWYRKNGIRKVEQLQTPPLPMLQTLELPKRSLLHYIGGEVGDMAPAGDDFLFRNVTKPIMLGFVTENGDTKGNPRLLPVQPGPMINAYHVKNRRIRKMKALETAVRDETTIVVYSYGLIPRMYRYQRSFYSEYYKWWNTQAALWDNVAHVAQTTDRHQFVLCTLPRVLPSVPMLKLGSGEMTQKLVKVFNEPSSLFLLELWKWLGEDRETSVLSRVPAKNMDRVNLIFQESGRWFTLNLGLLDSWRKSSKAEIAYGKEHPELNFEPRVKGFDPKSLQLRFLRLAMVLFEVRSVAGDGSAEAVAAAKPVGPESTVTVVPATVPVLDPATGVFTTATTQTALSTDTEGDLAGEGVTTSAADINHSAEEEEQLERELSALELVVQPGEEVHHEVEIVSSGPATPESGIVELCDRLADQGAMSAKEYKRYLDLAATYKRLPAPDGKGTLGEFIHIEPELLQIPESPSIEDIPTVVDKTMLKSSLLEFDEKYIKQVLQKDVAGMVMQFQQAGIAVTDYKVERFEDATGSFDSFEVKLQPVEGAASTFRFKLPAIEEDGSYTANGTKYRLRKQRGDMPIRKIAPDSVALTSYYGKLFARRSSKRVNNYQDWLNNQIMVKGLDQDDETVTDLKPANVFDPSFECPKIYSTLAHQFRGFTMRGFEFSFDHTQREALYGKEAVEQYEKDGSILCGINKKNQRLLMDLGGELYIVEGDVVTEFYPVEQLAGLDLFKAPVEFAELKVRGRSVPIGVILAYEMGLGPLMRLLKVQPRRVPAGQRVQLETHEYSLVFSDETLVFLRDDRYASLLVAGFNEYHRELRKYSVYEFDRRGVYLSLLDGGSGGATALREVDLLYRLFIDPITRDLLVEMGEPTNFRGLLLRATEMLMTDSHPDELDSAYMRIKGYERIAGAVYSEMVKGIRDHAGRPGKSRLPIDINPYAVWKAIAQDPSIALVVDINPIQNLKEQEAVTTGGTGGRSGRSMTKKTRAYHENDMGTISESTVDSSDVAINTFTSADPQFTSLRGASRRYKVGETGATALLSTSALISVASDQDDLRRVNFVGIQQSHGVACKGYVPSAVRTGYEQVLAHRTGDLFAYAARKPGKVLEVNDTGMVVEYEDGERRGIELGRRYGNAAGLVIPHSVKSDFKPGAKFKKGAILSYNDDFFERDLLNPDNVIWKAGVMVNAALFECTDTLEDSSVISTKIAGLLSTRMTKTRTIVVNFTQTVNRLVKVGREVEGEDILCVIEDAVTANTGLFDEESLDTLRALSSQTPAAKAHGTIERIEAYYHGDKEDMSESLQAIANASDRQLAQRNKSQGKRALSGSVDESFRVDGTPLALDTMAIRIYITGEVAMGVGDKGVFANQMKTVIGRVMEDNATTEDGKSIDAIFGYKSISDRIVLSPEIIGTTTTLLDVIGKKAVQLYKGK